MSEGEQGMLVLAIASVGSAIVVHAFIRNYLKACTIAAVVATIVFQVAAYVHLGHLDPFAIVALVVGGAVAFVAALVVGLPYRVVRSRNASGEV